MRFSSTLYLTFFIIIALIFVTPLHAQNEGKYYVISINENIDLGSQTFLENSIDDALRNGYSGFVIVLNTFGGYSQNMEAMIEKIQYAESQNMTVITLVAPVGAHATSAGSFIALACSKIYMVRGTSIGSATPVLGAVDNSTKTKVIEAFAAYARALAEGKGRNATAAEEMVTMGKSYTAEEAYSLKLIDGVLNASTVSGALSELGINYDTIHTPGFYSNFLSILSDQNVAAALTLLATFGLLFGLAAQSEILIAVGIVGLILTLVSYSIISPFIGAIALFLVGAILLLVELKIGEGLGAIPAAIFMAIGFLLLYIPVTPPETSSGGLPKVGFFEIGISQYAIAGAIVVLGSIAGIYLHKIAQTVRRKTAILDVNKLIDKIGYSVTEISSKKTGVVNVEFEEWSAKSDDEIPPNTKVKVIGIEGNVLIVKKAE
ncbi:MAG TPA: NfeD family protein [Geobacterales bacterium]|nr:NfeD family protein [Geobacterales bacterium]